MRIAATSGFGGSHSQMYIHLLPLLVGESMVGRRIEVGDMFKGVDGIDADVGRGCVVRLLWKGSLETPIAAISGRCWCRDSLSCWIRASRSI